MEAKAEKKDTAENVRVLRFFASDDADRAAALKEMTADGSISYEEMRKGSEVLVALECRQGGRSAALLDRCQEKLQQRCSPAMYATNEVTLAQAAVKVLEVQDKLFVAADAETSELLEGRIENIEGVHAVFDFGQQSYRHPRFAEKIEEGGALGRANSGDALLAAQGRVKEAFRLSGADFAVSCVPVGGQEHVILLGSKRGFWQRRISSQENAALWMLDMLRRAAMDKPQASGTSWQSYGAPAPVQSTPASAEITPPADPYLPPRQNAIRPTPEEILGTQAPPARNERTLESSDEPKEQEDTPDEPPYRKKSGAAVLLITLLVTAIAAAAAIALLWGLSGGDPVAYWNAKLFSTSSVNGASLM
jgi:hypothetical protein